MQSFTVPERTKDWRIAKTGMHKNKYCVYNTTRETFLSLGVDAADTTLTRLKGLIGRLKLMGDDGLWVVPSRGVHTIGVTFALDLIYLDADSRVIHILESFPPFHVAPLIAQAASVLQLPTHSIYTSHTQVGDWMLVCMANDMEKRLTSGVNPSWQTQEVAEMESPIAAFSPQPSFLMRMWKKIFSRDRRRADRLAAQNLTAYFWNGSAPKPTEVRDISESGLFLHTEEPWYPGTVVKMTLQDNSCDEADENRTIAVESVAVRSTADGTGLKFVLPDSTKKAPKNASQDGADAAALASFLKRLHKS